jgi:hypothetical protein
LGKRQTDPIDGPPCHLTGSLQIVAFDDKRKTVGDARRITDLNASTIWRKIAHDAMNVTTSVARNQTCLQKAAALPVPIVRIFFSHFLALDS